MTSHITDRPLVRSGSWLCENEIGFGCSAERKTPASPQSPKFRVRLYRVEFLHSQGHLRPNPRGQAYVAYTPDSVYDWVEHEL